MVDTGHCPNLRILTFVDLQKPYSPTHLGRRVRDVLDGNKAQD